MSFPYILNQNNIFLQRLYRVVTEGAIIRFKHFHDSLITAVILAPGCQLLSHKCAIFFNIYRTELNDGHFPFTIVIFPF